MMQYPQKKQILQLVALFKAHNIRHVVLSSGSRNAPLIHSFSQDPFFTCWMQLDERNAAFFALGLIQQLQQPVAVCCTSGTALLNYAPAVAEAYYQTLPLIVLSADREQAWIGQMDGQTVPQVGCLSSITDCSVQLPEVFNDKDEWYCNRLINEALIAVTVRYKRPVHINIPIDEPLFDTTVSELPTVRKISYLDTITTELQTSLQSSCKKILLVGQLLPNDSLTPLLIEFAKKFHFIILAEHLSNQHEADPILNFDTLLAALGESEQADFQPDLVITLGHHIVSKRLKIFLRKHAPQQHWHVCHSGEIVDLFQCVSHIVAYPTEHFLRDLIATTPAVSNSSHNYVTQWQQASIRITPPVCDKLFSDIAAINLFLQQLPENSSLHLANSSSVRHCQFFTLPNATQVFCNRGTNGIDGTLSTVMGFAALSQKPIFLIIGDLSFFYNLSALWHQNPILNVRVLLLNNGGGAIFHTLPKLKQDHALCDYVAISHSQQAQPWVEAAQFCYSQATNFSELQQALSQLFDDRSDRSQVVEVITEETQNQKLLQHYYQSLKS